MFMNPSNQKSSKQQNRIRRMVIFVMMITAFLLLTACGIRHYEADSRTLKKDKELAGEIESGTILNGSEPEKVSDTDSLEEAYNGSGVPDEITQELLDKYMEEFEPADDEEDYKFAMDYQGYDVIGFFCCRDEKGYKTFFGFEDVTLLDIKEALDKNTTISQTYKAFIYQYAVDVRERYPDANLSVLYTNLPTLIVDEVTPSELAHETVSLVGDTGACYIAEENRICVLEDFDLSESDNYIILTHELTHAARKYRYEEQTGDDRITRQACFYTSNLGYYAEEAIITNLAYELEGKGNRATFYPMLCNYYRIILDCIDYTYADYYNHDALYLVDKMDEFMGDDKYAWQIMARIDAQMDLRYNNYGDVDFYDFQPVYEYLAKMYFKKYITEDMTYEEAEAVFDAFYEEITFDLENMTRTYTIDENTFMPTFEAYVEATGIQK